MVAPNLAEHQLRAIARLKELNGAAGLFVSMGGGKTRVALAYSRMQNCKRILVVLPLSVTSVWERECAILKYPLPVIDLTSVNGIKERAHAVRKLGDCILLINYESYWREPLRAAILKWAPDAVILDEAHRIRNRGSRQSRFAHALATRGSVKVRLALTGTPITNGLQDAWSLYRFILPNKFSRYRDFAQRYLVMGGYLGYQIIGYQNVEELRSTIANTSFQWDGQTFETPPDVPVFVRLSSKTREAYDTLRKKAILEFESAQGQEHLVVTKIVLTQILRLQQITSGFVTDVDDQIVEMSTEKADATCDLVSDAIANHKRSVVFVRFTHDLRQLVSMMTTQKMRVAYIDGSVPGDKRKEVVRDFDAGMYDVLVAQIKTASLGIDLASAEVAIFHSVGFSLDEFLQAKGRLSGALRQRHPVVFYHILARNTVDEQVYSALSSKTSIARAVTDLGYALALLR